jgi:hypothetical protein
MFAARFRMAVLRNTSRITVAIQALDLAVKDLPSPYAPTRMLSAIVESIFDKDLGKKKEGTT